MLRDSDERGSDLQLIQNFTVIYPMESIKFCELTEKKKFFFDGEGAELIKEVWRRPELQNVEIMRNFFFVSVCQTN